MLGVIPTRAGLWFEASRGKSWGSQWPAVLWAPRFYKRCWKGPGQRASAHGVHLMERREEVWAVWRALFLPYQEGADGGFERRAVQTLVVSAETRKACALIGLHLLEAEGEAGSSEAAMKVRNGSALVRQVSGAKKNTHTHNHKLFGCATSVVCPCIKFIGFLLVAGSMHTLLRALMIMCATRSSRCTLASTIVRRTSGNT